MWHRDSARIPPLAVALAAAFAVLPAYVAFIDRFQIAPEEAMMARRFGGRFQDYRARTRRWI